jgi:hypothetical protein
MRPFAQQFSRSSYLHAIALDRRFDAADRAGMTIGGEQFS